MEQNASNWERIYSGGKAGSYLNYPSETLVTLFHQQKRLINQKGRGLDFGFGSANNSEFLIRHMQELHGLEVAQASVRIACERLAGFSNFQSSNFRVSGSEGDLTGTYDLIVAWQVLCYNDLAGVRSSIARLRGWLKPGGVLMCTLMTPRDVKVRFSRPLAEDTYAIDERIPEQEGCVVYAPGTAQRFLSLFGEFSVLDHGHFERGSDVSMYLTSEYYAVALKP